MGTFSPGKQDEDNYRFKISRETYLDFELVMPEGLWDEFIFSGPTGLPIKSYDRLSARQGRLSGRLFFLPGPYHLKVSGQSRRELSYELTLKEIALKDFEKEPNDNPLSATPILPNQKITGSFFPRDEDWFLLDDANAEKDDVTYNFDLSEVPGVDSMVELFDIEGALLHRIDQGHLGESESLKRFKLPYQNRMYLKVVGRNGYDKGKNYVLFAERQKRDPRWEVEPNASLEFATRWEKDQDEIQGLLAWREDEDFYYFSNQSPNQKHEGKMLTFSSAGSFSFALTTSLLDEDGHELFHLTSSNQEAVAFTNFYILPGKFLVRTKNDGTRYDPNKRYLLKKMFKEVTWGKEMEPNDLWQQSSPFRIAEEEKGEIRAPNDIDSFLVDIPEAGQYHIDIISDQPEKKLNVLCHREDNSVIELAEETQDQHWQAPLHLQEERLYVQINASNVATDIPYRLKISKI
jgi:hypothetical protein